MQLFVKTDSTTLVRVREDATGRDVKLALEGECEGYTVESCFLTFGGRLVGDDAILSSVGVGNHATLDANLRLLGGGKKRKKKLYSKPKKAKHKHKNEPLGLLKVYEVDDSGKVQRLRRQCPNCGPGVFMATHFERVYCGQCSSTYLYEEIND